jgi:hypothetical protein
MLLDEWVSGLSVGDRLRGWLLQCVGCGALFVARRSTAQYCSDGCRQRGYRERVAVVERDGKVPF